MQANYDNVMQMIADYVVSTEIDSALAYDTARLCLMDALGCAVLALNFTECTRLLGPVVPLAILSGGARVPGTNYELDPVQAAFNIGTMIRWLDFNDTWLAAEWGHPSDNIGAILAVADYVSRTRERQGLVSLYMRDVLTAIIKAYEIQGIFALDNAFNQYGLDHVLLVKLASSAVVSHLMGFDRNAILRVISQVFVDGQSLRTYRHAPNTGSRKSWAAGDACARAVRLVLLTQAGEMGYPSALTAVKWGFYDAALQGKQLKLSQAFATYVIENILFKLSFPAEFHAQTAIECAIKLHHLIKQRLHEIERIEIVTHNAAMRIIDKRGPLYNYADRDHCLQYMVAIALLRGNLIADDYSDTAASDPAIDALREKMFVTEDPQYSVDYYDPTKRAIANRIRIIFQDQSTTDWVSQPYPVGHPRRRKEGLSLLLKKCSDNLHTRFKDETVAKILSSMQTTEVLSKLTVTEFMQNLVQK